MRQAIVVSFVLLFALSGGCDKVANSEMAVTGLRCEYKVDPEGVDVEPRLGWIIESKQRGLRQSAYQIIVDSSKTGIEHIEGNLWDSGKVESSGNVNIAYKGKTLKSGQRCWWRVRVWDGAGKVSSWSEPAVWSMGLLQL